MKGEEAREFTKRLICMFMFYADTRCVPQKFDVLEWMKENNTEEWRIMQKYHNERLAWDLDYADEQNYNNE